MTAGVIAGTIGLMRSRHSAEICLVLGLCLGLAPAATAQSASPSKPATAPADSHPNFSGTWVMNAEKSDWGGVDVPDSMRYVIHHSGASLVLISTQDAVTKRLARTTDGQERMTEEDEDSEIWTRVYWEGKTLVWEGRRKAKPARQIDPVSWTSRWSLSDDGKVLTVQRQITVVQGTLKQTLVFDKK